MSPIEHGEVYVTKDGGETDLDLGYYERMAEINVSKKNSISAGKLLFELLNKERRGEFLGKTVQLIPHFTNSITKYMLDDINKYDFTICEIGGSAGDYEAGPFLEAVRQVKKELKKKCLICLVTFLVYYKASKELKTKPSQVAIKQLMQAGIQPDILFTRSEYDFGDKIKKKLSLYSNVSFKNIIAALNVPSIYKVPLEYAKEGLVDVLQKFFNLKLKQKPKFEKWKTLNQRIENLKHEVTIGLVGKYVELEDSYYSVIESLNHAGWYYSSKINLEFINARKSTGMIKQLEKVDGVLVPGGFGTSGIEEMILAIKYCRENKKPFMGICLGMQLSVIEFARNVANIKNASSSEFGKSCDVFIVDLMKKWKKNDGKIEKREKNNDLGGTLRLGSYQAKLKKGSLAEKIYGKSIIEERHRHRYEVNIEFKEKLESKGMIFSGLSPDGKLPEIVEIKEFDGPQGKVKHPYFIAGQFHPEFNSTPFDPHPMFKGLIKASIVPKIKKSNKTNLIFKIV